MNDEQKLLVQAWLVTTEKMLDISIHPCYIAEGRVFECKKCPCLVGKLSPKYDGKIPPPEGAPPQCVWKKIGRSVKNLKSRLRQTVKEG